LYADETVSLKKIFGQKELLTNNEHLCIHTHMHALNYGHRKEEDDFNFLHAISTNCINNGTDTAPSTTIMYNPSWVKIEKRPNLSGLKNLMGKNNEENTDLTSGL